jgi:hypothetical protein
MEEQRR